MNDPDTWFGLATVLAFTFLGAGSWIAHRKLRSRASLALLLSITSLIAWFLVLSPLVSYWIIGAAAVQGDKSLLNIAYIADSVVIPAVLLIASSVSFFAVARSLKPAV